MRRVLSRRTTNLAARRSITSSQTLSLQSLTTPVNPQWHNVSGVNPEWRLPPPTTRLELFDRHTGRRRDLVLLGAMNEEGTVHQCRDTETGEGFAVKMTNGSDTTEAAMLKEIEERGVQGVLGYHGSYENTDCVVHLHELAKGGDLFDFIQARPGFGCLEDLCLSEQLASQVFAGILKSLSSLHNVGIVHRDVKCENILLRCSIKRRNQHLLTARDILLSDFGLAYDLASRRSDPIIVGSHGYMAPEVYLRGQITPKIDAWASGVILYMLLSGLAPFQRASNITTRRLAMSSQKFAADELVWGKVSAEAKDLISGLLLTNPDQRMCVDAALEHPWLQKHLQQADRQIISPSSGE